MAGLGCLSRRQAGPLIIRSRVAPSAMYELCSRVDDEALNIYSIAKLSSYRKEKHLELYHEAIGSQAEPRPYLYIASIRPASILSPSPSKRPIICDDI